MVKAPKYGLIGDIGGTHARFGLSPVGGSRIAEEDLVAVKILKGAHYATLVDAVRGYLSGLNEFAVPTVGCIALAGPVTGSSVSLTNMAWRFSRQDLRDALDLSALTLINDYCALANAVPFLGKNGVIKIGRGVPVDDKVLAVVGPGSGLGVSGLVPTPSGPVAISSEGGHISFAPFDEFESQVAGLLRNRFERISNERVLSGPGIENLYQAIAKLRGHSRHDLSVPEICRKAVTGTCEVCHETLERFCGILGGVAGDIALAMGAKGGIYIAGGIVPRFIDFLEKSTFRRRFEEKGRFHQYMASIPTYVMTSRHPGLLGAAVVLNQHVSG